MRGLNYRPRTSIGRAGGVQPVPASLDYDLWSGPAPIAPLRRRHLHYDWHWDWLYGDGDLGNMGIHNLDGCRMAVGDRLPRHAIGIGGRFGYQDDGQTPNTQIMYFDYEPAPILFEVRGLPKNKSFLTEAVDRDDWGGSKAMDSFKGVAVGKVIECENGYIADNKAFANDGTLIKQFEPHSPNLNQNFIDAVRSRRAGDLVADILQGHLSAALVHVGNISHRVGRAAPEQEIRRRIEGRKDLAAAYESMKAHLLANGIDLDVMPVTLGAMLTIDPNTERFVGEFSDAANMLVSRKYRETVRGAGDGVNPHRLAATPQRAFMSSRTRRAQLPHRGNRPKFACPPSPAEHRSLEPRRQTRNRTPCKCSGPPSEERAQSRTSCSRPDINRSDSPMTSCALANVNHCFRTHIVRAFRNSLRHNGGATQFGSFRSACLASSIRSPGRRR